MLDPGPVGAVALVLAGVLGLTMFLWPLVLSPAEAGARSDSPLLFVAILPVVIAVVLAEMARGGGLITHQDLTDYRSVWREPVTGSYRGYQIISMPPPSAPTFS